MVKKEVLANLIDEKKAAILRVLLNSSEELYLKEIADKSNVPLTSAFRILLSFVNLELITKRRWKTSTVYSCKSNEKVDFLRELFHEEHDSLEEFVSLVKSIPNVNNIILHGARKKGKANVLLIGEEIDVNQVEKVCKELKEKGFEISYLTLTKEQYAQMAKMGLYSGEKKILG